MGSSISVGRHYLRYKMNQKTDLAKDVTNEITKMMAVVDQEFRIPMTSILFNIQSLKRMINDEIENSSKLLENKIEAIEAGANQISRLLEHVMDLAQTHVSEIQMRKNLIHTHDLLSGVITHSKKLTTSSFVQMEHGPTNQYCFIDGDKDRLTQVLSNLIANLISFSPNHAIIKLSTITHQKNALFIIKDENCFLGPRDLATIFDKISTIITPNVERVGLGLALSKWIIEAHDGKIWIESSTELGTAFFIELPKINLAEIKLH